MDIRQLVAESAMRGFIPNPWLWNSMIERSGIQAIPGSPNLPMQTPPGTPGVGASPFDTLRQIAGGAMPLAQKAFGGFSAGSPSLDNLINQASTLLGGAGGLYGLGTSIASGNVPGIVGGALSTGALASRMLGSGGLLGGAGGVGSLIGAASPYLGGLGTLTSLATGIKGGNIPQAIIGAVPGLLSSTGQIAGSLAAPSAAEVALGGAVEAGATSGAAAGGELAGLAGLGSLGGAIAPYAVAITLAMQDAAKQRAESRRDETLGIQRNFPGAWSSLESAPKSLESVAAYDRVPGGGGVDLSTAIKNAQDAIYRTGDISSFLSTEGGRSQETKPTDVSSFAQAFPRLESDALLTMLKGSQDIARSGGQQPADTNVFMGPFANQFGSMIGGPEFGSTYAPNAWQRPQFNPNQALFQLAGYAGLETPTVNDPRNVNNGQWYYQGLQDPNSNLLDFGQPVGPKIPHSLGNTEGGPAPDPWYDQEFTTVPHFNANIEKQLAGVTPSNEYDALIGILRQANPNFDTSTLGTEVGNLGSTKFPGHQSSGTGGGTGLPFAPFLPSAGQQSADKQQLSSDPNALATPININSGNTLDKALEASKAFLGSS